jgi:hypothetical protein
MDVSNYAGAKVDWCYIPDNRCLEDALRVGELQGGALACSPSRYRYPDNGMGWQGYGRMNGLCSTGKCDVRA